MRTHIPDTVLTYRDLLEFITNLPQERLDDPVVILDTYYEQYLTGLRAIITKYSKVPHIEV